MQDDSTSRRNEGRFFINSKATKVTLTVRDAAPDAKPFTGQLADLSRHGVKISIDGKLEIGREATLRIEVPSMNFSTERSAIARWQQPRDAKTWWTGCQILPPFDETTIEGLAAAHVLNRRRDPRYELDLPAKVRWELTDQLIDVTVKNFSKGGFCVQFPQRVQPTSERLLLVIDQNGQSVTIAARCMWQGPVAGGYAVGCSFTSVEGFLKLRDFAEPVLQHRISSIYDYRKPLSKWIAIGLLVLAIRQGFDLVQRQPSAWQTFRSRVAAWFHRDNDNDGQPSTTATSTVVDGTSTTTLPTSASKSETFDLTDPHKAPASRRERIENLTLPEFESPKRP